MRRAFPALLLSTAFFFARTARGDGEARVLVLAPSEGDALAARVEAELRAIGFAVTVTTGDAEGERLEAEARKAGAAAAIRVVRSDRGAEVWVADRITGKTLLRTVEVEPGEDRESVLAVRAVELLRASLLEIETAHPSRGDVVPPPVALDVVRDTHVERSDPPFSLAVGLGPQLVPTISPSFHAFASLAWSPSRLGIEAIGLIPIAPGQVCKAEGCSEVEAGLAGGGVRLSILRGSRFRPEAALGFAAAFVHATGQARAPYVGASASAVAATAYGRIGLAFAVSRHLRIGLDVLGGAALPPPAIRFAGAEVAHWGGPFGSLLFHTEVAF